IIRNEDADYPLTVDLKGFEGYHFVGHTYLHCDDPDGKNTYENPDYILPKNAEGDSFENGELKARVKPLSWNVFHFSK
ncbi:MAG: alpha-L-arabinofuranosidase, partial [Lachnospiraceae bacterium]|nr:alpha-L-arabinofuranosidase [Lachnospiraceae bacterium]